MQNIEPDLDIYELAYLAGGGVGLANTSIHVDRVLEVAIVHLIEQGYLLWDIENKVLIKLNTENDDSNGNYPLLTDKEHCVLNDMPQNCTMGNLVYGWVPRLKVNDIRDRLESCGLIYSDRENNNGGLLMAIFLPLSFISILFILFGYLLPTLFSLTGILISGLISGIESKNRRTKIGKIRRNKKKLLERYTQQIPASATNLNGSLSKAYALYGSVVLTDSKFEGLAEFFKPSLIFDRQSTYHTGRKQPDADSGDFDIDYDNTSFDNSCSSDSGCSAGCSSD